MGFGGTTEKLQKVASMAEDVYAKLNELRDQMQAMRETVERVDRRTAENRALLEALAAEGDVDVDAVLTETAIEEAETEAVASAADETTDTADGAAPSTDESTIDTTTESTETESSSTENDSPATGN